MVLSAELAGLTRAAVAAGLHASLHILAKHNAKQGPAPKPQPQTPQTPPMNRNPSTAHEGPPGERKALGACSQAQVNASAPYSREQGVATTALGATSDRVWLSGASGPFAGVSELMGLVCDCSCGTLTRPRSPDGALAWVVKGSLSIASEPLSEAFMKTTRNETSPTFGDQMF